MSAVFIFAPGQSYRAMASGWPEATLQIVFGKAFLVELQRGNLDSAKLFARAFLLRTPSFSNARPVTLLGAA